MYKRQLLGDLLKAQKNDRVEEYHSAREALLAISRAIHDQGEFSVAADFRIAAMRTHLATRNPVRQARRQQEQGSPFNAKRFLQFSWAWLKLLAADLLCKFGESISRVLGWMFLLLFIAGPALLLILGGLSLPSADPNLNGLSTCPVNLDLSRFWQAFSTSYFEYILYMFDTFTTSNFSPHEPATKCGALASSFIAMLGIFLAGLLGFVTGNRLRNL